MSSIIKLLLPLLSHYGLGQSDAHVDCRRWGEVGTLLLHDSCFPHHFSKWVNFNKRVRTLFKAFNKLDYKVCATRSMQHAFHVSTNTRSEASFTCSTSTWTQHTTQNNVSSVIQGVKLQNRAFVNSQHYIDVEYSNRFDLFFLIHGRVRAHRRFFSLSLSTFCAIWSNLIPLCSSL